MSFLRHREIYPSDGGLTLWAKPPLIVWMSFRLAIPWRVALQQCPPPLHQPATFCYDHLRSSTWFQRTATCPSFLCLTPGAHRSLRPSFCSSLTLLCDYSSARSWIRVRLLYVGAKAGLLLF